MYDQALQLRAMEAYRTSPDPTSAIAAQFGVSPSTLTVWATRDGIPLRARGRKSTPAPSPLNQRRLDLVASGMTLEEVGAATDCSKQRISSIIKRWGHVLSLKTHAAGMVGDNSDEPQRPDKHPAGTAAAHVVEPCIVHSKSNSKDLHMIPSTSVPEVKAVKNSSDPQSATHDFAGQEVEIALVHLDVANAIQTRASLNKAKVREYAERMTKGDKFPAANVFDVDGVLRLVDGIHRRMGAERAGKTTLLCVVTKGTWQEALCAALGANSCHGMPLSNKDKRCAVSLALKEWPDMADRAISDMVRVSHTCVIRIRRQLEPGSSSSKRVGKDGKTRKVPQRPAKSPEGVAEEPDDQSTSQPCSTSGTATEPRVASSPDNEALDDTTGLVSDDHAPSERARADAVLDALVANIRAQLESLDSNERRDVTERLASILESMRMDLAPLP